MAKKPAVRSAQKAGAQAKLGAPARVDLERFAEDYRLGTSTTRELAAKYAISEAYVRKLAKQLNLTKDLAARVRARVQENLVRRAVRKDAKSDEQRVDQAAGEATDVVVGHQQGWARFAKLNADLALQLELAAGNRELVQAAIQAAGTVAGMKPTQMQALLKLTDLPEHAAVAKDLAITYEKIVAGQRKAHGIEDGPSDSTMQEELRKVLDSA